MKAEHRNGKASAPVVGVTILAVLVDMVDMVDNQIVSVALPTIKHSVSALSNRPLGNRRNVRRLRRSAGAGRSTGSAPFGKN
jgi:hypothetical protein